MPFPIPPYAYGNPAAMGAAAVVPSVPWIDPPNPSTPRHDFDGWVGCAFTVGLAPISVTQLGRIFLAGNAASHDVGIFSATGDPLLIVTVDCSTGTADTFNYMPGTLTLNAATVYIIASLEVNLGDFWYEGASQTTSAVAVLLNNRFRIGSGTSGAFSTSLAVQCFVPPNFKYTP